MYDVQYVASHIQLNPYKKTDFFSSFDIVILSYSSI